MDMTVKPRTARSPARKKLKTVNLALQGGGAHGAFAWGVLDRLIEDGRLAFEGISATSAGAMNAAVLASGWTQGGPEGARRALACRRRLNFDPPCRLNFDPGMDAGMVDADCG